MLETGSGGQGGIAGGQIFTGFPTIRSAAAMAAEVLIRSRASTMSALDRS
jgi:hypothetical protein